MPGFREIIVSLILLATPKRVASETCERLSTIQYYTHMSFSALTFECRFPHVHAQNALAHHALFMRNNLRLVKVVTRFGCDY